MVTLNLANDLDYVDTAETMRLYVAEVLTATVASCIRSKLNRQELQFASQLGIELAAVVFLLPVNNLSSNIPTSGNAVRDAGDIYYEINASELDCLGLAYRVICTKQRS